MKDQNFNGTKKKKQSNEPLAICTEGCDEMDIIATHAPCIMATICRKTYYNTST